MPATESSQGMLLLQRARQAVACPLHRASYGSLWQSQLDSSRGRSEESERWPHSPSVYAHRRSDICDATRPAPESNHVHARLNADSTWPTRTRRLRVAQSALAWRGAVARCAGYAKMRRGNYLNSRCLVSLADSG